MVTKLFNNRESGFTLIELLIVCVIIGVLMSAVLPNLTKFIGTGTIGAANTELATVKSGVMGYIADHNGNLPCTTQPTIGNPQPLTEASIQPYLANAPVRGGYLVDVTAGIIGDPNHLYPGLTWDAIRGIWTK
jgi:type IV pilus assembly protein PilA